MRDSLLAASGRLDVGKASGPSFSPEISAEAAEGLSRKSNAWKASPAAEQGRRSVFMLSQRSLLPPLATVFDFPDTTLPCGQRDVTTVAPQALALLNNSFVHQQSEAMARRVLGETATAAAPSQRVQRATGRLCLDVRQASRNKRPLAHIETQRQTFLNGREPVQADFFAWASLCHVLLNANEFIFVD